MKNTILILLFMLSGFYLFSQTRTEMQQSELQKPIKDYIDKNYNGFSIGKIFKVDTKGQITYDICITKDKTYEKLFFDKEGKFLKKESCTHECCAGPSRK